MEKYKVIDLFCGAGGLGYGFAKDEMFDIVLANDIDKNAIETYKANHHHNKQTNIICSNITDIEHLVEPVDIIIGGPPCQAFSTFGKRDLDDPRSQLFREYCKIISKAKPKIFIFENVKGLLSIDSGKVLKTIIGEFESLGYNVQYKVLDSANYGVPQHRERVIIVGTLTRSQLFNYPKFTHSDSRNDLPNYVTLKDAICDLEFIESNSESFTYFSEPKTEYQKLMRENSTDIVRDHNSSKHSDKLIKIMEALPDGGSPMDIPEYLRPSSGFKTCYCRLWWEKPSVTITRNLGTPSSNRCIHPIANRALTTREGARLQSFPDDYVFCGSRGSKNLQIGNAVPPLLSLALKDSVKDFLNNL